MHLTQLEIANFRNIHLARVEPHPHFNLLEGPNGAGKSNLLEALYVTGSVKSFRPGRNQDLIRLGEVSAHVQATVERGGLSREVRLELSSNRKRYVVNDKAVPSFADYLGILMMVVFTPSDLHLLRGQAAERRRFIDRVVCGVQPTHLVDLQDHAVVLKQRNQLLKDVRHDSVLLEVYTEQMVPLAARIMSRRIRVLSELSRPFDEVFRTIFSPHATLECEYRIAEGLPGVGLSTDTAVLEAQLKDSLSKVGSREKRVGHTLVGPQRDDLELLLDGLPAKEFSSQGQMRAIVLSMKISEIKYLQEKNGQCPVLLLDDVSSELDRRRNEQLFSFIREVDAQTWITTTDRRYIQISDDLQCYQVQGGEIELSR